MASLIELISEGEHQRQDFKFKIDDLRKIGRTLCAFANTDGGRLLIGINDKHKIVGCDPQKELHLISESAKLCCMPEVKFSSKIWQEDFRLVLEINIDSDPRISYKARDDSGKWHIYLRLNDHTTIVNKIAEGVWFEKKNPIPKPSFLDADQLVLLNLIKNNQPITLSQLYKLSSIQLKKVDKILISLICWDMVKMKIEKDGISYYCSEI